MENLKHHQPVVLFDAVGTLIYPSPGVDQVYESIGQDHGSSLSREEIRNRFVPAFRDHFARADHPYEVNACEVQEKQKWKQVVREVFGRDYSDELFADLWSYFSHPENWFCFDDVKLALNQLVEKGILIGVASNFDARLKPIVSEKLPQVSSDRVFYSTEVGFAKPDVRFFKRIESILESQLGKVHVLMIGDNWKLDVEAPRRAGWNSIWKDTNTLPDVNTIESYFLRRT